MSNDYGFLFAHGVDGVRETLKFGECQGMFKKWSGNVRESQGIQSKVVREFFQMLSKIFCLLNK